MSGIIHDFYVAAAVMLGCTGALGVVLRIQHKSDRYRSHDL
jgi:hypothetical protein